MRNKLIYIKEKVLSDVRKKDIIFEIILCILIVFFSMIKLSNLTVIAMILLSFNLLKIVKYLTDSYINLPFIYTFFHVLYGISGVVSVTWLDGLSSTYGYTFNIYPYAIAYSLCTIFLLFGLCWCFDDFKSFDNNRIKFFSKSIAMKYFKFFLFVAIVGFSITLIFELINFIRVGGFAIASQGKAIYQAKVDELFLTLPTQQISQISFASFGIYLIFSIWYNFKISKKSIIAVVILLIPYTILLLYLGRRGPLLAYFLIFLLCFAQIKHIKKITKKIIVFFVLIYICLGSLYGARNYINLIISDFGQFCEKFFSKKNLIGSFDPGKTEFGCTFGNFNRLIIYDDYDWLYGKSYVNGMFNFIPNVLYPGEKPLSITYQFRNKYFPNKASISSIASTAFSSILESYWNFGYFGSLIYILYGYLIMWLEKIIKKKNPFYLLFYISILPLLYEFHRSDFGHVVYQLVLFGGMIIVIYLFYSFIYKKTKFLQ